MYYVEYFKAYLKMIIMKSLIHELGKIWNTQQKVIVHLL